MKGVRFWGTRGSLPIALTARDVKEKLLGALRAARGRPLAAESDLEAILAGLPFSAAATYGGHTSCVQIDTGGPEFFVCDMAERISYAHEDGCNRIRLALRRQAALNTPAGPA